MKNLYLKQYEENNEFKIEDEKNELKYKLIKKSLKTYIVEDFNNEEVSVINQKRILFLPANLPQFVIKVEGYENIMIYKDINELKYVYKIDFDALQFIDSPFDNTFKMYFNNIHIANITKLDEFLNYKIECIEFNHLNLISSFIFALALILSYEGL